MYLLFAWLTAIYIRKFQSLSQIPQQLQNVFSYTKSYLYVYHYYVWKELNHFNALQCF